MSLSGAQTRALKPGVDDKVDSIDLSFNCSWKPATKRQIAMIHIKFGFDPSNIRNNGDDGREVLMFTSGQVA